MKSVLKITFQIICFPFLVLAAIIIYVMIKKGGGVNNFSITRNLFLYFGFYPVADQYYQPLIHPKKHLKRSLREDRNLSAIDFNQSRQIELLSSFNYREELVEIPFTYVPHGYYFKNASFESGDSEYLYSLVRHMKPSRIIEIGSGYSSLMTLKAIERNKVENSAYSPEFTCIEPYEQPWLEKYPINVIRKRVEDVDIDIFKSLKRDDILFIDSSHIIRPQGDILYEYLEILPLLNSGVIIHIHDIFSPKDYLDKWIFEDQLLWNEQYLVEAFLSFNKDFKIIGAVNYLKHHYWELISSKLPVLEKEPFREPGSFWIQKV